jgi:hypothetical protein
MLLHTDHDPAQDFMPLLAKVREEVAVIQPPAFSRTAHTFSHIFAGGYAAGYYSYKWAEVLSADAYAAFEETMGKDGLPSIETGRKYRQAILEAGGSRPAIESFRAFVAAIPLDALLRHQGWPDLIPLLRSSQDVFAPSRRHRTRGLLAVAGFSSSDANAQQIYRIVGPGGRIRYSDKAPLESPAPGAATAVPGAGAQQRPLPFELRQAQPPIR